VNALTLARQIAFQVLYQLDVAGGEPDETHRAYVERWARRPGVADRAWSLIDGCLAHRDEIDRLVSEKAENWSLDRIAPVDRNVLRLGAFELLHAPATPPKVAIDEAIELAKRFGQTESGAFVNAILDAIRKDHVSP